MGQHGIIRKEWVARFRAQIIKRLYPDKEEQEFLADEINGTVEAELDSWREDEGEWAESYPEDSADDNLSYWND